MAKTDITSGLKASKPPKCKNDQVLESSLLDKAEAAAYLGTTERHIQRLWAERRIPAVKVGRKVRFRVRDLDAWIDAHTVPEVTR